MRDDLLQFGESLRLLKAFRRQFHSEFLFDRRLQLHTAKAVEMQILRQARAINGRRNVFSGDPRNKVNDGIFFWTTWLGWCRLQVYRCRPL